MKKIKTLIICFIYTVLLGFVFIVYNNLENYISILKNKFEIGVFIEKTRNDPEVIEEKIRTIDNVKQTKLSKKEDILEIMTKFEKEIKILGRNPFPDTVIVKPQDFDIKKIEILCENLKKTTGVEEVKYDKKIIDIINGINIFLKFNENIFWITFFIIFLSLIYIVFKIIKYKLNLIYIIELFSGLSGIIVGIICLKILSSKLLLISNIFITGYQLILLIISGIFINIIININDPL